LENSKEIWDSFVEGEDTSFRQLIFSQYDALYNYGIRFSADGEQVKDAIQDLFLILWNKRGSLSEPVNIKAYLFSSLRRILHRKHKAVKKLLADEQKLDHEFNFQVSIEMQYINDETARRLAKKIAAAIEKLPPRQKEVVYLKFYHGFSRDEIVQAMDITPQTVSNLLQIALGKLKDEMGSSFDPHTLYLILPLLLKEFF
jgi:RNA polymerase sigma factor (sigma-70 family)